MAAVVCVGELLIDFVCDVADASLEEAPRFLKAPGGAPANVAVGVSRWGKSAAFVGKVGDDPFGDWLKDTIARENVDVTHLFQSETARTTLAFVATKTDGTKDICFYRNPGADAELSAEEVSPRVLEGAKILHVGSVTLSQSPAREAQFQLARQSRERGVWVSFDPNWRPSLWDDFEAAHALIWEMMHLSDIVKIADEEWKFVTGTEDFLEGAKKVFAAGAKLLFVTKGGEGALYFANLSTQDGEIISGEVAGQKVNAIDTLGAGDAFVAALLAQLSEYSELEDALSKTELDRIVRHANASGAFATQTPGAIPSLPTRAQAEAFV